MKKNVTKHVLYYLQVRKTIKTLEKLTEAPVSRRNEIQATKKIIAVIGVFFVCHTFSGFIGIIAQKGKFSTATKVVFLEIIDLFSAINCSINIIIYALFDPKFKKIFQDLFISCSMLMDKEREADSTSFKKHISKNSTF